MTIGIGIAPSGTSPAGVGAPVTTGPLAKTGWQMSSTGAVSSVEIDPNTKDYVFDPTTGSEEGMGDIEQRVWLLCQTRRGSRTNYQDSGLATPRRITPNLKQQVEAEFKLALAPAIEDGSILIKSIEVESLGTQAFALVRWVNLNTDIERTTRTALQA